ncbi:Fe-only nitrogenase accessory protein AnfO [Termitidicoccus mucosus]|uniref:Fe-only nitrogenase accessory protein AnfO n=1 Tax=Termitidicoccus mucosus TaxID=1184151 RepID=A0A178IN94_9BACT|nr:hypothetical protein AW736_03545 [Opitutaceae bacterium TSB47]
MKIASYVDEQGCPAGFYSDGVVRIYAKKQEDWEAMAEIPLRLQTDMGLGELNVVFKQMVSLLGDCRIFVVGELRGVPCAILDSMGFSLWKAGLVPIQEQLPYLARQIETSLAMNADFALSPEPVGNPAAGIYHFDLGRALKSNGRLNSRQLLLPFLESASFKELTVLCDHCPRWLDEELDRLNLQSDEGQWDETGLAITIKPIPPGETTRRPVRRPRSHRCGCSCME